jgi:C4-dicarboxylate-specific signal transduction histidine kinase
LTRVEQDYRRQHDLEHQLLRLNAQHSRILQLEKLSALGTMVGSIAHQLNNPLVGVVNLAQLAEREAGDPQRIRDLLREFAAPARTAMLSSSACWRFPRFPVSTASRRRWRS